MKPDDVYWDKPDLADDLRKMGDNLFPGTENCLRHAMLHGAARRIEAVEAERDRLRERVKRLSIELGSLNRLLGSES